MACFEYMKLALVILLPKTVDQYNFNALAFPDCLVYLEIRKGVPGLKQANRIANALLTVNLIKFGYAPVPHTPFF